MTKFTKMLVGAVALTAIGGAAHAVQLAPACHSTLTENSGWQYGQDNAYNSAQVNNGLCFTVPNSAAGGDTLSLTDGFIAGDVYKVTLWIGNFQALYTSTFTAFPTTFHNNTGPYAAYFSADWLDNNFSHLQIVLSPGNYELTIKDQSNTGYPAGFGVRLDSVPEPASWALMMIGVGGLGGALRARRKAVAA